MNTTRRKFLQGTAAVAAGAATGVSAAEQSAYLPEGAMVGPDRWHGSEVWTCTIKTFGGEVVWEMRETYDGKEYRFVSAYQGCTPLEDNWVELPEAFDGPQGIKLTGFRVHPSMAFVF